MAAVTNIVELLFKVSDQASGPSKAITSSMDGIKSAALAASAAALAVGGGALYAAKKAVDLGQKFEDTSLSIAGALQAYQLAPNIEAAEKAAVRALGNIDRMAAKLPGTTEDYVEVFKQGLPAAIAAGTTDLDKIADFTSRYTAVATANMVDAQQAGSDLSLMLTGVAGQQVAMFRKLSPLIGKTAEEFNKMTREARMAAIDKSLAGYAGMMERAGNTLGSRMGEAEAHVNQIVRLGTVPIFTFAVEQLGVMNEWFVANKQEAIATVKVIAEKLVGAFKKAIPIIARLFDDAKAALPKIIGALDWVKEHAEGIETAMEAAVGVWLATSTFNGISAILKLFQGMAEAALVIEGAALTSGGAAVAGGAAAGAGGLSGGAIVGGVAMSVAKALTTAGALAAGAFAYTLHGTLADEVDMREHFRSYQEANEAGLKMLRRTTVEDWNAAAVAKIPAGPKKTDINFHNARFDIRQNFAEGYDPDRIAAAFVDQIGAASMYRSGIGGLGAETGA